MSDKVNEKIKSYLVTTIDKVLTVYVVPAKSEEEARQKIEGREPSDGVEIDTQEYYDLDRIESVEENI